ncbi:MAG: isoleucine--tRNA ligase [Thermoprotei archaeon]|nr:MAG: isoleucine--tRNA ligase [Thermoprotei archaeon]
MLDRIRRWEEEILNYWSEKSVYDKVKSSLKGKPVFNFIDGPPYPTGPIHLGHSWNKTLKDIVLRFWRMRGYDVVDTPGFDMHGLPIEVQVEKKLNFKSKTDVLAYGVDKFISECKKLAFTNVKVETEQFRRLGVWMDWEKPYLTVDPTYIDGVWWTIKRMHNLGRLYQGWKVLGWCPRCQTVLAQHEYEYKQKRSPSLYFKVKLLDEDCYVVVWTTTPWTLIGNMVIAVHPDEKYVKVKANGELWILSKYQVDSGLLKELGVEKYEVVDEFPGRAIEGKKYVHPLLNEVPIHKELEEKNERCHTIITSAEYVHVDEGTGCLHVAPSFGPEDFEIGTSLGLPLITFVDGRGVFDKDGGYFEGKNVNEASELVVKVLDEKGLVVKYGTIVHEYPHCWRCKTPLIFRLTKQWFFRVKDYRDKLVKLAEETEWIPSWAKALFIDWLKNIEDWCISRQRFWGTPLPIWICEKCGYYIVVGSIKEVEELSGKRIEDPHRPFIDKIVFKCPNCGGSMKRVPDVIDVWIDSGSVIWSVLPQVKGISDYSKWETLEIVLEGKDQIRGWFSALFVLSAILFGKLPYKRVYMHGFVTDERGVAMHKSLGNVILPDEVIEKYCAEILRFYQVISTSPGEDQRFGYGLLSRARTYLTIFINTYNYLSQLAKYHKEVETDLAPEDEWLLSRINSLIEEVTKDLESYQIPDYARKLYEFLVEDVSRFYIQLVRERMRDETEAGKVLHVLKYTLDRFLRLAAPLNPMLSEKIFIKVMKKILGREEDSVHMLPWPSVDKDKVRKDLEEMFNKLREVLTAVKRLRQEVGIKARWPCRALYIEDKSLSPLREVILRAANVKEVIFETPREDKHIKTCSTTVGTVGLDVKETRELMAERLMRDISRHVRAKRKELGLRPIDRIKLYIAGEKEMLNLLNDVMDELKERCGADEVVTVRELPKVHDKVEFKGHIVQFYVEKAS